MKNVRNTLFVVSAAVAAGLLASLCSGCDGSGGEVAEGGDAGRSDAVKAGDTKDSKITSCVVPTPRLSLGGLVTTTPRDGYRIVETESVPCLSTVAGGGQPTDCSDPVDGFAKTASDDWYCVYTQKLGNSYYLSGYNLMSYGSGEDYRKSAPLNSDYIPGGVALCSSTNGKFLGWDCNTTDRW